MYVFQADAADRSPTLYAKLDAPAYEWKPVEVADPADVRRISIGVGGFFPGPFENNPAWRDQEYVLGRLDSLRRFRDVEVAHVSVTLGPPLVTTISGYLLRNANFTHLPRLADGLAAVLGAFPRLHNLMLNFQEADPGGAFQVQVLAACRGLRTLQIGSVHGVLGVLGRLPAGVTAVRMNESAGQYQALRDGKPVYLDAIRPSGEEIARAIGGRRLEALSISLDGVPGRSAAFAQLLRPLRELELELGEASQRDLDALATHLAGAKQLRRLHLVVRGERVRRGEYELLGLAAAVAGLQLEDVFVDLAADWGEDPRWSYQHVLLLNGLLRSERLRYAFPGVDFPLRGLGDVGDGGAPLLRAVQTYPIAFGPAALPPEMLLKVIASASGYPEWFLVALRLRLDRVVPYLRGRRERGGRIGFFREEREETESEGSGETDESGSDDESEESGSDDEMAERPFAR